MSINKTLFLASGVTYATDVFNSTIEAPALEIGPISRTLRPILLGNRSLTSPVATLPTDFVTEFTQKNIVSFLEIPVYPNKLISASLTLSSTSIPLYNSSFNIKISVGSNINASSSASYFDITSLSKYSGVVSGTIGAGTTTFNVTPLINYLTTLPFWLSNSRVTLFVEGPSSGNQLLRVNTQQSYLSLSYNPVVPFSPQQVEASPGFEQVLLSWQPPSDNGGSSILDYTIEYREIDNNNTAIGEWIIAKTSTVTSASIDNLSNKSKYIARVRARNAVGLGSYSTVSNIVQPQANAAPRVSSTYNDANYTRIRLRRDTSVSWSGVNPILGLGEPGYETDTKFIKVGDNVKTWNDLDYVRVPNSSIQFPTQPPTNLVIGDGEFGSSNPRILCNLSNGEFLNIVGRNGVTATYSNLHQAIVLSLTQT